MDQEMKEMLNKKISDAKRVIREALDKFKPEEMAITWTGGKDSTMVLWLFRQVCEEDGVELPVVFSIDEFDHFDEIHDFIDSQGKEWGIDVKMLTNQDVVDAAGGELNAMAKVAYLNERNQKEIERLGYEEDEFPYEDGPL
jgi:phosphoadenosine phosphosulfate reductase